MPAEAQSQSSSIESGVHLRLVTQASDWQSCLAQLPDPHVLQSWEWGSIKSQTGWSAQRYVVADSNAQIVGAFQLLLRSTPLRLPFRIGYIPKGPLLDWSDSHAVDAVLSVVQDAAQREHCLFVKIDPNVGEATLEGIQLLEKLGQRGWRFSDEQIQFKNTGYSYLESASSSAKETLLAQMKSKWRYNIRLAKRRGVEIRHGNSSDLGDFYALYAATSKRDGFAIRPFDYYEKVWESYLMAQDDLSNPAGGQLILAEHADEAEPLAGLFLMKYGQRVWYFYGASSERRRRDMPNYLLQHEAMEWAVDQGATVYDWWGAPTNPEDPDDRMGGVWRFKQGFGAELQHHIGAWDWAPSKLLYTLYSRMVPFVAQLLRR